MFQVKATCEAGHTQTITYDASFSREMVEVQAGLLDGTWHGFKYPPGTDSVIGKCGICGKPIKCEVIETTLLGACEEGIAIKGGQNIPTGDEGRPPAPGGSGPKGGS
jgi:hypothetical protein